MKRKLYQFLVYCMAFTHLGNTLLAVEPAPLTIKNPLDGIDAIIENAIEIFNVPGIAIGVIVDGQVFLSKGYGHRNLEANLPVTENTLFAIGSCSKAFTCFLLGQLVDEGKINWDDTVITYLPEFRLMDEHTTTHLTIRDLVAHRSGLARHDLLWFHPEFKRSDVIPALKYLEPACDLREKFQYNNLMYTVAGMIIEKVTGQTWEEVISARIFYPLGMQNSNLSVAESQKNEDHSLPYAEIAGEVRAIPFRNLNSVAPAGAINSNVSDMLKWIHMHLSDGNFLDKALIRKETLKEMQTTHMPTGAFTLDEEMYAIGYGLGWFNAIYRGNYYPHHGGGIDGFISQVSLLPLQKIGIVVLSNSSSDGSYIVSSITNTIIDKLLGKENINWIEKSKNLRDQVKKAQQETLVENKEMNSTIRHLDEYVGEYEHPAYGTIQIKEEEDHLVAYYGDITISLSHKCYDIFIGKTDLALLGEKNSFTFSFLNNVSGDICELHIPIDQTVKAIIFKKKANSELFLISYLTQFEGKFGEDPITVEVSLKGNKLVLISQGQETELIPDKRLKFNIKGLPGHHIHFTLDEDSKVRELIFTHPLGSLNLKIQ